jgi:hypothetical protein
LRFWRGVVKRLRQEQIVLGALSKSRGNLWIFGSVSARYHVARKPPEIVRVHNSSPYAHEANERLRGRVPVDQDAFKNSGDLIPCRQPDGRFPIRSRT